MTNIDPVALSKATAHALRHQPWLYELELDPQGWVTVDSLLEALSMERTEWTDLTEADLHQMIAASDKKRYEIEGGRIRARYGHSVEGRIEIARATPPSQLFHGTSRANVERIHEHGLLPMRRQYVHLSATLEMAQSVGKRVDRNPVLLVIDAAGASTDGIAFYTTDDLVWLVDKVPARYLGEM